MFDQPRVTVVSTRPRTGVRTRFRINGREIVEAAAGAGARGLSPFAPLPAGRPSPSRATGEPRRVDLGEPECTGGCCGFPGVVVRRCGGVVEWADRELPDVPDGCARPPAFHFDADAHDAELARAERDRWGEDQASEPAGSTAVSDTVPSSPTDQPGLWQTSQR